MLKALATYLVIIGISALTALAGAIGYDAWNNPIAWVHATQYLSGESIFLPDKELGFIVKPNLSALSDSPERAYYTDSRSARVGSPGLKAPATVDFISVGDSQTLGDGVRSEDSFTGVLAKRTGYTGMNLGQSGYGGVGSLLLLRRNLDLKPKFIVYGFWEDHLNRNVKECLESGMPFCTPRPVVRFSSSQPRIEPPEDPFATLSAARMWYGHDVPPYLKDFAVAVFRNWGMVQTSLFGEVQAEHKTAARRIAAAQYIMKEMKSTADAASAQLVVVYIPLYFADINDVDPALKKFSEDNGIMLVDMGARLREMRRNGLELAIPGNGHMTAPVHAAIAEEVQARLVARHKAKS